MTVLDSLLKEYPDHSLVDEAWFKMAEIEDRRRNWSAEDSLYKEILQRFPESVLADDALYRRAELYENKLKDTTKAMELYQGNCSRTTGQFVRGGCPQALPLPCVATWSIE